MSLQNICKYYIPISRQIQKTPKTAVKKTASGSIKPWLLFTCLDNKTRAETKLCHAEFSTSPRYSKEIFNFNEPDSPQGIQGEGNCEISRLWHTNISRRSRYFNLKHKQGIQGSGQSVPQVLVEQDNLTKDMLEKMDADSQNNKSSAIQGVQNEFSAFPKMASPCPQGVQGDDCVQYKIWLENCYRYGIEDCVSQYDDFLAGRKSLQQIFTEQEKEIKDVAEKMKSKNVRKKNVKS